MGFDEVFSLWMLSTPGVGGLNWSNKEIGEVRWTRIYVDWNIGGCQKASSFIFEYMDVEFIVCINLRNSSVYNTFNCLKNSRHTERLKLSGIKQWLCCLGYKAV